MAKNTVHGGPSDARTGFGLPADFEPTTDAPLPEPLPSVATTDAPTNPEPVPAPDAAPSPVKEHEHREGEDRREAEEHERHDEEHEGESGGDVAATEDDAPARPLQSDRKDAWVAYAVAVGGLTEDEANAFTKAELIEEYGAEVAE